MLLSLESRADIIASGIVTDGVSVPANPVIYPLGDSITLGTGDTPNFGYRDHLQNYLGIGNYNFVGGYSDPDGNATYDIEHGGVGGTRTANVLARTSRDLIAYLPKPNNPDTKILLLIGTNDSASGVGDNLPPPVTPSAATSNVVSIVNAIVSYDANINIYVGTIVPHREFGSVKNNTNFINFNNELTPAILSINSSNPKVHLVDLYSAFVDDTFGLLSGNYRSTAYTDDTHPNNLGYTVIARQWDSCIQNSSNVNCDGN